MPVLSYRRGNGVPENKPARSCRGRSEFYLTLAPISPCPLFSATYLLWGLPESLPAAAYFRQLHHSVEWDISGAWLPGCEGTFIPCEQCGQRNTFKSSRPPASFFPPLLSLSSRASSVRYSCNVCLLQRATQLQSTEQPRHAVFTYSWLWPRIDFFSFISLRL